MQWIIKWRQEIKLVIDRRDAQVLSWAGVINTISNLCTLPFNIETVNMTPCFIKAQEGIFKIEYFFSFVNLWNIATILYHWSLSAKTNQTI